MRVTWLPDEDHEMVPDRVLHELHAHSVRVRDGYRRLADEFGAVSGRYVGLEDDAALAESMGRVRGRALSVAEHMDSVAGLLGTLLGVAERPGDGSREVATVSVVGRVPVVASWSSLVEGVKVQEADMVVLSGRLCRPVFRSGFGPYRTVHRAWRESGALRRDAVLVADRLGTDDLEVAEVVGQIA